MINCEICWEELKSFKSLSNHLRYNHKDYTPQKYYDEFIKKENEGICKLETCDNKTKFKTISTGYAEYCSHFCCNKHVNLKPEVRAKIKRTLKEKYGDENYVNCEKCKETKREKYGYDYFPKYDEMRKLSEEEDRERVKKIKKTKLERYGDENYCNVEKIKKSKMKK